jgi:parallel beta-helix repeat protein
MKSLFFFTVFASFLTYAKAANYYFSTNSGNDVRTPKQAQNPSTPWKTLSKLNSYSGNLKPGDHILFKRGETFFGSITINKSGTSESPIVFSAYGAGEKPVITSLITLTDWIAVPGHNGVYESSDASLGKNVNLLLLNNVLQQLGRYPNANAANKGYLTFESHNSYFSITDDELPGEPNWTGAQAVIRNTRWKLDRVPITSHSGNTINYNSFAKSSPLDNYGYFIQNDIKTLDQFGEWYFNPSSKKMNVFFGGKNPLSYTIQTSTTSNLIHSDNYDNLVFDNLTVKGGDSHGFRINSSTNVTIQNCDVLFSGNTGISIGKGSANLKIEDCKVSYSNSCGINLTSSTNAIVRNNIIRNSGAIAGMGGSDSSPYKGIELGGSGNLVENNKVDSSGYMGIHFIKGDNQTIKNNVVNTFGFVKDDGGGIYTEDRPRNGYSNRKVIGNIILNGTGAQAGTNSPLSAANGIYMDSGTDGVEIAGNTVANTFRGIYIHNSNQIVVKNNTLYSNAVGIYFQQDKRSSPIRNNTIINNIAFSKSSKQVPLSISINRNDIDSIGILDSNYYYNPFANGSILKHSYKNSSGKTVSEMLSLNDWKKRA